MIEAHHVVQKLESPDCSNELTIRNFWRMVKNKPTGSGIGREVVYSEMTKDGFVFLVMGFTGKKAAAFKQAYIAEFNRMEAALHGKTIADHKVPAHWKLTSATSDQQNAQCEHSQQQGKAVCYIYGSTYQNGKCS